MGRALLVLAVIFGVGVVGQPAAADTPKDLVCGGSWYVDKITVHYDSADHFKISVTPKTISRVEGTGPGRTYITNFMWHNVQACVPGLYGTLADSIWQQLDCHRVFGANVQGTGPTYDLESWHRALQRTSTAAYFNTHCLNEDGVTDGINARVGGGGGGGW